MTRLSSHGLTCQVQGRVLFEGLSLATEGCLWIQGPSGCGKSTLLRCLAGLVPHEGVVELDGVARGSMPQWRSQVAYVAQRPPVAGPRSAKELLSDVVGLAAQRDRDSGDPVGIAEGWGLDPDRWDAPMRQLSGGEAQRVWLAIVLSRRPSVLLLDEPTASLDAITMGRVEADLAGIAAVLVTHDDAQGERLATDRLAL